MAEANKNSMAKSAVYNMIAKFGQMGVQLIVQMVLARLIDAADFGIVAIITVALNFLNMFADMGLGVSIIQHEKIEEGELNNIFTGSLYMGFILMGVMALIAYPMSVIYKNSVYIQLFLVCSVVALFNSLNVVPNALLMRRKRFDLVAIRTIVVNVIAGIVAIAAAYAGAKYYALVINYIVAAVGLFVWNYISNREYGLRFVKKIRLRALAGFTGKYSLFQFLFNVLNYFTRNLDYLFIGAYMGDATLGYYQKAYTLNLYPNQLFTNVISSVFHPYMRSYKDDTELMYKKWVEINAMLSVVAAFVMSIMFAAAEEIVLIMFGDGWQTAVGCLRWLSVCVWAQMLSSTCGAIFLSLGRTDQTFKCGVINVFIILAAVILGLVSHDIHRLSLYIGISYNVIFWITVYVLVKDTLHRGLGLIAKQIVPDFCAAIIAMTLMYHFDFLNRGNPFVTLILKVCFTGGFMLCYLAVTRRLLKIWRLFVRTLKSIRRK